VTRPRGTAAALALCWALAAAGCGLGPGGEEGSAELRVTRDYGEEPVLKARDEVRESDTVMRLLDRSAEIETRYGGGFVQSIEGIAGGERFGRRHDWFFYVNGIESSVGAAEFNLSDGDRVWWDHRDWTSAMRVPAVVGSFPEPFVHGFDGERWAVRISCFAGLELCEEASRRIEEEGASPEVVTDPAVDSSSRDRGVVEVLVGEWGSLRGEAPARLLSRGPELSGVFAKFGRGRSDRGPIGDRLLFILDPTGRLAEAFTDSGLVAAVRPGEGPPTWIVTGTTQDGLEAAVELLNEGDLRDRYSVAATPGGPLPVPVQPGEATLD